MWSFFLSINLVHGEISKISKNAQIKNIGKDKQPKSIIT